MPMLIEGPTGIDVNGALDIIGCDEFTLFQFYLLGLLHKV